MAISLFRQGGQRGVTEKVLHGDQGRGYAPEAGVLAFTEIDRVAAAHRHAALLELKGAGNDEFLTVPCLPRVLATVLVGEDVETQCPLVAVVHGENVGDDAAGRQLQVGDAAEIADQIVGKGGKVGQLAVFIADLLAKNIGRDQRVVEAALEHRCLTGRNGGEQQLLLLAPAALVLDHQNEGGEQQQKKHQQGDEAQMPDRVCVGLRVAQGNMGRVRISSPCRVHTLSSCADEF